MKTKTKNLRSFGLSAIALMVCFAIMLTCFAFFVPASYAARAAGETGGTIAEGVSIVDKCDYGESFTVPVGNVKVTAPNGTEVALGTATDGAYKIAANQIGNYSVVYGGPGDTEYAFNVYVTLEKDYFLKVDYDGADIPTYIQKDGKFKLPGAKVVYYDDNNILREYPGKTTLTITDSIGDESNPTGHTHNAGDEITASQNGKLYITYSAAVGENGKKFFNKTFTVNVQSTLTYSGMPTLSVSGVSKDISIRRPVTLPKATATDSYDENVKIEITVLDPDGNKVRVTDIDEYGYAQQDADKLAADADANYPYVMFDNDKAMTFYPVKTGTYTVTYLAVGDSKDATEVRKSTLRSFTMTCSDLVAPVFYKINDYMIPDTWGMSVEKADENGEAVAAANGGKITIPLPTLVDNKDHMPTYQEGDDDNLISLYLRISDSDYSRTIVEFNNVLASGDSSDYKFKGNATYGEKDGDSYKTYEFSKTDGFTFDLSLYNRKDASGEATEDRTGSYTVYYRASDKAGNRSSKTYTVKIEDKYTDTDAPAKAELTTPEYISATEKSMTVPSPVVADANDSRPHVVYRIYTDNGTAANYIDVEGGEDAELITRDGALHLVISKDKSFEKSLKLGTKLYYYLEVTDDVGNVKCNTEDSIALAADSNAYTKSNNIVKIIAASSSAAFSYTSGIAFPTGSLASVSADTDVEAGEFSITTDGAMRYYTGFEIAVRDPKGNPLNVSLDTFSVPGSSATIYVKNIKFRPSIAGKHTMTVRVFDVNGVSSVYGYTFDVTAKSQTGGTTSAITIPNNASVNVKYKLHNDVMTGIGTDPDGVYYVARRIEGSVFSVMGNEFTAKYQGGYAFQDGYVEGAGSYASYDPENDFHPYGSAEGRYNINVTDTAAPVIEVQGVMPTYAEKKVKVTLPSIIAYSANGNAEVKVEVTDKTPRKVDNLAYDKDTNTYSFTGMSDGAYTVTVTATYKNAAAVSSSYVINIGKVVGPEFTVDTPAPGRLKVGDTFTFGKMELVNESASGITITKKLIDPSREEVSSATVSGSFGTYSSYANNGTDISIGMSGTYEVVYTAEDSIGNKTVQRYTFSVVSSGSGTPTTFTTLSTVLIIVAVVLLAGVIVYVVRFRKVKK